MTAPFQPHAAHDREADAVYVYLSDAEVEKTKTLDDLRLIDYSADGKVVGIELLSVSAGVDLSDIPYRQKVEKLIGDLGHGIKIFA